MTLPVLGSPLPGFIHPKGWARPAGNLEFVVTSTLADHLASGRAAGTDFGNTQCGAPVALMLPGTCYQKYIQPLHNPPQIGDGALIARFKHADGGNTGYAHLASFGSIAIGGVYPQGHIVGSLGKSGASACHLHAHYQDAAGVHHEVYDLLAQNQEADMVPIPPGKFVMLANKKTSVITTGNANFRAERLTSAPILKPYPPGTAFTPLMQADDGTAAGGATPTRWFGGFGINDAGFAIFGWFHSSVLGPLVDTAPPADCSAQVTAAVAPLNVKIANAQAALA